MKKLIGFFACWLMLSAGLVLSGCTDKTVSVPDVSVPNDTLRNIRVNDTTFQVVVDYTQSLAQMIQAGHYDQVDPEITAEHFPTSWEGRKEVEIILFHFPYFLSSEREISAKVLMVGFRPANVQELLALGASQPDLQRQFPITTSGQTWYDSPGNGHMVVLNMRDTSRILEFGLGDGMNTYLWNPYFRFVAVRSSFGIIDTTFQVAIDYSMSLDQMIQAGHYDQVDREITTEHFPTSEKGQLLTLKTVLFYFDDPVSLEQAIHEMDKVNFRPATPKELLALGASQPDLQRQFTIAALGQLWQGGGSGRAIITLDMNDTQRKLDLNWFADNVGGKSGKNWGFAAVQRGALLDVDDSFRVVVDYSKSLAEMIQVGNYYEVDPNITAEHFPLERGEGVRTTVVRLFHFFHRYISSVEVIAEMDTAGYRPASPAELLALCAAQPDLQRHFEIVDLGQFWQLPDGHRLGFVFDSNNSGQRRLYLGNNLFMAGWNGYYCFGGVSK